MDPNANLARQRIIGLEIAALLDNAEGLTSHQRAEVIDLANELVELVQGLDQWISRGGFLPSDWRRE